jgi:RHS repeat-associated protein
LNYTGQQLDGTGLLYYHARYYDANLGRFISADRLVPDPNDPQDFNRYSYVKNNPVLHTDPTGHVAPIRCPPPDCRMRDDISQWSDTAKNLAVAGCFVLGCEVDLEQGVIVWPSPTEQLGDMTPGAVVAKGAGTALRRGSRVYQKVGDTVVKGQRVRRITSVLAKAQKNKLRREAKLIYDYVNPGRRVAEKLEIHHRIPLEYAHLFPDSDPNRLSNLVGLTEPIHDQVEARWKQFAQNLGGISPNSAQVQRFAMEIDKEFSIYYR